MIFISRNESDSEDECKDAGSGDASSWRFWMAGDNDFTHFNHLLLRMFGLIFQSCQK